MAGPVLYVELVPTTKGIKRNIESDLNGTFSAAESRGTKTFGKIGKLVGGIAAAAGAAAAAVTGLAIKGGFERMLKIEDATAKLDGLGHSAETVDTIMGSALASVKGTAYGLDTAATVAASAVAAGIKPGQELEKYLRLTADAATIAGISMDEMGAIMNKVQANGRAMTENLNQLQDRGIPILQWLAEEYGVSAAEMSKMVSQGKVDAETFNRVIEENIGGAALRSGETTRGAWANMLAALSRVGVALLEGVFPYFKDTFNGITGLLDDITGRIGPFRDAVSGMVTPAAAAAFESLSGSFSALVEAFKAGGNDITSTGLNGFLEGLGLAARALWDAIGPLLPQIIELWSAFSPLGALLGPLGPMIGQLAQTFGTLLGSLLTALMPPLLQVAGVLQGALLQILPVLLPLIGELGMFFGQLLAAVLPLVGTLISALLPVFNAIIPVVLAIISALMPFVSTLIDALMPVVLVVVDILTGLFAPILEALVPIITAVLGAVMALIVPLLELLGPILGPLAALFSALIEQALTPVLIAFQFLIPVIVGIVEALANFLIPIINTVMQVLGGLINFIVGVFSGNWEKAWSGIVQVFTGIFEGVSNIARSVINLVIDAINGIIGGINAVASTVKDATGGVIDIRIGKIPRLASGAIVEATMGGSLAVIGEGRYDEAVVPLAGPQAQRVADALSERMESSASRADEPIRIAREDLDYMARVIARHERAGVRMGAV